MNQIWLEVSIDTRSAALEALAAYLTACGIVGLVIEDENDLEQFEDENRPVWSEVDERVREGLRGVSRVKFYLPDGEDGRARLAEITAGLEGFRARTEADAGTLAVHVASLQEEDWAHNWQQYYQPFPVGEKLYVVPEWLRDAPVPEGRTALYLNPGLIFGTGSHSTTQLCLEGLEACVRPGDRVLDLGCGSGILSIAALRLGAATAVGCDIDPKAARVAAENAAYNGIGEEFRVHTGDIVNDAALRERLAGRYEIVLANIIADVIIPLAPVVPAFLAPGGRFLCSGIIEHRAGDVADALRAAGWTIWEERRREGWVSLLAGMAGELG